MISAKTHGIINMKRRLGHEETFSLLIFAFLPLVVFAAPFGLKMGMTIDEISAQCEEDPSFMKDDVYLINPKKSYPLFSYYAVYINQKVGLYQIRAISDSVTCNKYGTEIQNAFNSVKDRIAKTYGKPKIIDKVDSNSLYKDDNYWFHALKEGSRQLSAVWGEKTNLTDDLLGVALDCVADTDFLSYDKAHLVLYYYFTNAQSVEDEQDDVF